jgi:hypothetical protein
MSNERVLHVPGRNMPITSQNKTKEEKAVDCKNIKLIHGSHPVLSQCENEKDPKKFGRLCH